MRWNKDARRKKAYLLKSVTSSYQNICVLLETGLKYSLKKSKHFSLQMLFISVIFNSWKIQLHYLRLTVRHHLLKQTRMLILESPLGTPRAPFKASLGWNAQTGFPFLQDTSHLLVNLLLNLVWRIPVGPNSMQSPHFFIPSTGFPFYKINKLLLKQDWILFSQRLRAELDGCNSF